MICRQVDDLQYSQYQSFPLFFSEILFACDLWCRKINFTSSKTLVGVATDRDARNLFFLPEWKEPFFKKAKKREQKNKNKKENEKTRKKKKGQNEKLPKSKKNNKFKKQKT